jgi:hypothetical protein
MKLRTRHLACLIVLLSALSGAEASTLRAGDYTLGGHYITALLAHEHAAACAQATLVHHTDHRSNLALPAAALSLHRAAWTMRSPSAHSTSLQAATAFGI